MARIKMTTPLVEIQGDEMTRVLWDYIKEYLLSPHIELNTEFYDLGLLSRDKTEDNITIEAAEAIKKYGVGVKCATITPNVERMSEYNLTKMWASPNATIRAILDGTVFRAPILSKAIKSYIPTWTKPITIARHAYGDVYKAVEIKSDTACEAKLVVDTKGTKGEESKIASCDGGAIFQGIHNTVKSISSFARSCFNYALATKQDVWFATKDTISKIYDGTFKQIFMQIFESEYKDKFFKAGIKYEYSLIDDSVARVVKSNGGFIWALKNYDGDVMSDMVASAYGSLAMMTSVLVSPNGAFEYEAAHGTVTRHYYKHLVGEKTSTNPVATIFAWTGALKKRGEIDNNKPLSDFALKVEQATLKVIESGIITGDLKPLFSLPNITPNVVDSLTFIQAIGNEL